MSNESPVLSLYDAEGNTLVAGQQGAPAYMFSQQGEIQVQLNVSIPGKVATLGVISPQGETWVRVLYEVQSFVRDGAEGYRAQVQRLGIDTWDGSQWINLS